MSLNVTGDLVVTIAGQVVTKTQLGARLSPMDVVTPAMKIISYITAQLSLNVVQTYRHKIIAHQ
jgi:hypothetical protein